MWMFWFRLPSLAVFQTFILVFLSLSCSDSAAAMHVVAKVRIFLMRVLRFCAYYAYFMFYSAVWKTSATAIGCIDSVISTCSEVGGSVVVTKHHLSPQNPRSSNCDPSAPLDSVETTIYPRCDVNTGIATTCSAANTLHRNERAGMLSL